MTDSIMQSDDRASFRVEEEEFENLAETHYEIKTENCGYLNVHVQGDPSSITPTTPVFLTVHDIGSNHHEFHKLVEHPGMAKLKSRSIWIHVDMPGQEFDSPDLPQYFVFPSLDKIAADLLAVIDFFKVKYVITLGEGAGANILLRFSISNPDRVLGNILIHCVVSVEGMTKYFQDKIMSWKLSSFGMNTTADQYLVYHKFGMYLDARKDLDHEKVIKRYLERLHKRMNPKNLRLYVDAYLSRNDLASSVKEKLKVETMIVSGSYPNLMQLADEMQAQMDPKLTTRVNLEHCGTVLTGTPEVLAYDLLLFCQGLGLFSALPISRRGSIAY